MLLLQILTLLVLLLICVQDLRSRSVYWVLFPILTVLFMSIHLMQPQLLAEIWPALVINTAFLVVQLLIVSAYFSIKSKHWVNITDALLGWGDILFLASIAFYLSVLNFLFFYITSLAGILVIWLLWQFVSKQKNKQIPLAGIQALIFTLFLATDWWYMRLNLTMDEWLLRLMNK